MKWIEGAVRSELVSPRLTAYYNAEGLRWCGRGKHWVCQEGFGKSFQWCKECRSAYTKKRYDPILARKKSFRYYYGEDYSTYEHFFVLQGGKCAICAGLPQKRKTGKNRTEIAHFSLDHDHATGRPRGLLCPRCNFILGWMRDNPHAAERVKSYLEGEGKQAS